MRRLRPPEILDLFDRQVGAAPFARADALIDLCYPDGEARDMAPGTRNLQLMRIREAHLGRRIFCLSACAACGERMELTVDTMDFGDVPVADHVTVEHQGRALRFRLPSARDVEAAARTRAPLLQLMASLAVDLPDDVSCADPMLIDKVSQALDAADPLGCIIIETACPACGAVSRPVLDPAALVWREFAALARRLEDEVHALARAYGWSEPEILALPDQRRRRYVERVTA